MQQRTLKFRIWSPLSKSYIKNSTNLQFSLLSLLSYMNNIEIHNNGYIQQFTGLLDKNNKEIFEGDIVKFREIYTISIHEEKVWHIGKVVFDPPTFYIKGPRSTFEDCEIIGNVFENRNLIRD